MIEYEVIIYLVKTKYSRICVILMCDAFKNRHHAFASPKIPIGIPILLSTPMGVDYVVIGFDMEVQPLVTHNAA